MDGRREKFHKKGEMTMYTFVSKKEAAPYRRDCEWILRSMQHELRKKYDFRCQLYPVGSCPNGVLTKNEEGHFDLDYDMDVLRLPEEWARNPHLLKDHVRMTLDSYAASLGFLPAQDSTSVLTAVSEKKNFSFDLCLTFRQGNDLLRLIHDKGKDTYIWNIRKDEADWLAKRRILYNHHLKAELQKQYLHLKNTGREGKSSLPLLIETISNMYNQYIIQ
jgi:hypothetical protein